MNRQPTTFGFQSEGKELREADKQLWEGEQKRKGSGVALLTNQHKTKVRCPSQLQLSQLENNIHHATYFQPLSGPVNIV